MSTTALRAWRWWRIDVLGMAGGIALTLVGVLIAAGPATANYRARKRQQMELLSIQDQLAQAEAALRKTDQQWLDAQQALEQGTVRLRPVGQINQHLADLAGLAKPIGLKVDLIQPDRQIPSEMYITLPIHFSGTASFPNCVLFLHKLRQRFPDTAVPGFYLTSRPGDVTGTATFQFELVWYAQPLSSTAKRGDK